jgi:hypothetical protein
MAKLNEGEACRKLRGMYNLARSAKQELQYIDHDATIDARQKALAEYRSTIGNYQTQINEIVGFLTERVSAERLLVFIMENALVQPGLLPGLANLVGLTTGWDRFPHRGDRD